MTKPKIICVVGATGAGKTGLGVQLCKKINGEIISADSRQVYRGLDISSGKDLEEYGDIKYHLIDICEPGERFTLFDWLKLAKVQIDDVISRGKLPIVVGGTMLYVSALVEGYQLDNHVIARSQATKQSLQTKDCRASLAMTGGYSREELDAKPLDQLQEIYYKLKTKDYKLDLNNPRRLIRAIEKAQSGDKPVKSESDYDALLIGVDLPRQELYKRIDRRADERFKQGMLAEIQGLLRGNNGYIDQKMAKWLVGLGLDFRVITNYLLENGLDASTSGKAFEEMLQRFKFAEHNYARRQLIWWRKKNVKWTSGKDEAFSIASNYLNRQV